MTDINEITEANYFCHFCNFKSILRREARTWLMAGSGGQRRHDSRRLLPGSLLAVENGSAASEG